MGEQGRAGSNKIKDIVRLQQLLRKWRRLALAPKAGGRRSGIPRGFFAVCVGEEMKRFVIPTEYLGHWAFGELLREAEEEFGFRHEGAIRIPCDVQIFEGILRLVGGKNEVLFGRAEAWAETSWFQEQLSKKAVHAVQEGL